MSDKDPRACSARGEGSYSCGKLNSIVAGHADILATILAWKSSRMSVQVGVRDGAVECQLIQRDRDGQLASRRAGLFVSAENYLYSDFRATCQAVT